jgi:hypothetical protein
MCHGVTSTSQDTCTLAAKVVGNPGIQCLSVLSAEHVFNFVGNQLYVMFSSEAFFFKTLDSTCKTT